MNNMYLFIGVEIYQPALNIKSVTVAWYVVVVDVLLPLIAYIYNG